MCQNFDYQLDDFSPEESEQFLITADKVRLKKLQDSSKNVKQMIDWMMNSPGWQGDDLDECLEIVENSRVQAEF